VTHPNFQAAKSIHTRSPLSSHPRHRLIITLASLSHNSTIPDPAWHGSAEHGCQTQPLHFPPFVLVSNLVTLDPPHWHHQHHPRCPPNTIFDTLDPYSLFYTYSSTLSAPFHFYLTFHLQAAGLDPVCWHRRRHSHCRAAFALTHVLYVTFLSQHAIGT
jgi:hypothetical protein